MKRCPLYKQGKILREGKLILCDAKEGECSSEFGRFHKEGEERMYTICGRNGFILEEKDIPYIY